MFKKISVAIFILCSCLMLISCDEKGAWEGDYEINNRTDLNELSGYTSVTGNLLITHATVSTGEGTVPIPTRISSLSALESLTEIGGSLTIKYVTTLESLDGLKNLTSIGGDIVLKGLPALTSMDGFKNLTTISGDLNISGPNQIKSMDTFSNVTRIGGDLHIISCESLTTLGFESLYTVGNDFTVIWNLSLPMSLVEDLRDQIQNEGGIGGPIEIQGNYDDSFPGTPYFGNYDIYTKSDIDAISGINIITGDVRIMTSSYYIPFLGMVEDQSLESLQGLEDLQKIGGSFWIYQKDNILNLEGLNNLVYVGGGLSISSNINLSSLSEMESLSYVGDSFYITNNASLPASEAEALRDQVLSRDGIDGNISINNNLD
ncbi:MAG: hypothetical protein KKD44_00815 [Proteobacteria bacterium]|nr:hypothetical protein [Pseudomonadota bacterium]